MNTRKHDTHSGKAIRPIPDYIAANKNWFLSLTLVLCLSLMWMSAGSARGRTAVLGQLRSMESDKTGLLSPTGLAFSSKADSFYVLDGPAKSTGTDIVRLTPFASNAGSVHITDQVADPINIAYDEQADRLLLLQFPENQLLEVREDTDGNLDQQTLVRYDASRFGLLDPQGMAVGPTGTLFILDVAGPRIVRIQPGQEGDFDNAVIDEIDLSSSGLTAPHGLAFEESTSHFYLTAPTEQKLYEVNLSGRIVAGHDLSIFKIGNPQGLVFAPSGDQTDDGSQMSLYLADNDLGQILEFSLTEPTSAAVTVNAVQSTLVRTVDLAALVPPSPDPSGVTYLPFSNTLLISDGEVEEKVGGITHFAGANLWELTLNGGLVRTANVSPVPPTTVPMTDEPTGVAWNPLNGHYYFSDDNAYKVFDLNPGLDGSYGTADDSWTSFDTLAYGAGDPEGITFDTWHNQLFVVDGTNREIYQFTLTGSLVSHFDVAAYGVTDPEGVEFNPESGTLFVLSSSSNRIIVETTTSGALLQTIDVSASRLVAPAGLAYAPASDGSGARHFYIVDRGIDNNIDPNIIDGKMYELDVVSSGQPTATLSGSFTPTLPPTSTAAFTFTPTSTSLASNTPTRTATSTSVFTATATATLPASGFPVTGILDSFDRANGAIGSGWTGDKSSFAISGNQLVASSGGMIFWNATAFGADQEAYVTFANIDSATTNMDLLLKSQTMAKDSFLEVTYNPTKKTLQVETYTKAQGYVSYGTAISVTFVNGDQLGVRAAADGTVSLYRNGTLLGTRNVSAWANVASGGYMGLLSWGGTTSAYDNFGGGTLTSLPPTSTITTTPSPSAVPSATFTSTPTALQSPTPPLTTTFTPTAAPSNTSTPTPATMNTGFLSPSWNVAQTGGDGNGYEVSAANIYTDDGLFAVDNNSGTGTSTSCTNSGKDKHRFSNYNIVLPNGATVKGIQVQLHAKADSTSGSPKLCVQLSWDGGTTWTSAKSTATLTTVEAAYLLGGTADTWGHTWTTGQFGNSAFIVRVIDVSSSTSRDFSLDWVSVQVTYQ